MKFLIDDLAVYGRRHFPYSADRIADLHLGVFGDFEYPYNHKVLCAECICENEKHIYVILGEYQSKRTRRKYWIFGKPLSIMLFAFKSKYRREDIEKLLKNNGGN